MVISTSNLMETFTVRCASRDTLYRSVGQLDRKQKYGGHSAYPKINRKRPQIAEISCPIRKSGSRNRMWWCQNFNRKFINSRFCACAVNKWPKVALNAVKLPKFEAVNGKSWSPRTMVVKNSRHRSRLTWFCACAESYPVFNTGP